MFFKKKNNHKYITIAYFTEFERKNQENIQNLVDKCSELGSKLMAVCRHDNFELTTDTIRIYFSIDKETHSTIYFKRCIDCGVQLKISKKQYLQYQKETIESSLRECS